MIIVLNKNPANVEAANLLARKQNAMEDIYYYPELTSSSHQSDKTLRVLNVELSEGLYFPPATSFVEALKSCGILDSIEKIEFFMPDFNYQLIDFVKCTVDTFYEDFGLKISGSIITNINYKHTLLFPPSLTGDKWEIYGLKQPMDLTKLPKLEELYQIKEKKLLFKGNTLDEWFNDNQRLIEASAIKYEELQSNRIGGYL